MQHSILNVHAEDEQIANANLEKLTIDGRKDPLAHAEWKPNEAEERAVRKVVDYAHALGARVHISHMSSAEGVAIVKAAKRAGVRISTETCPHYLTFTRKDMKKQGPYLKMNPSLKGRHDVQVLWKGLRDGTVDIVTSEHAPGTARRERSGVDGYLESLGWRTGDRNHAPRYVERRSEQGTNSPCYGSARMLREPGKDLWNLSEEGRHCERS